MQAVCLRCNRLASTERPCKGCGSPTPMIHTHCPETHWSGPGTAGEHTLRNCPHAHAHPHRGLHDHDATGAPVDDALPPRVPFKQREAWFLSLPWVSHVRGKVQCEAFTTWTIRGPRKQCKKAAKYRYRPLKSSFMTKGAYCWDHATGADMNEDERIKRYIAKNPPPWRTDAVLEEYRGRDWYDRRSIARG